MKQRTEESGYSKNFHPGRRCASRKSDPFKELPTWTLFNIMVALALVVFATGCGVSQSLEASLCDGAPRTAECNFVFGSKDKEPEDGEDGKDGIDGTDGQDGVDGTDGLNGVDGADGKDGLDAQASEYDVTEIVDPCGDFPGYSDEVLLKLANGDYLVYMQEGGGRRYLAVLDPGTYRTTDRQRCRFRINIDGSFEEL